MVGESKSGTNLGNKDLKKMETVYNAFERLERIGRGTYHQFVRGVTTSAAPFRKAPKHLRVCAALRYQPKLQLRTIVAPFQGVSV